MRLFRNSGWTIEAIKQNGIFYTGSSVMDSWLSIGMRIKLRRIMGSACNIFVLKKNN